MQQVLLRNKYMGQHSHAGCCLQALAGLLGTAGARHVRHAIEQSRLWTRGLIYIECYIAHNTSFKFVKSAFQWIPQIRKDPAYVLHCHQSDQVRHDEE